jgi:DNA-binding beta-propeller fold protein YncE
MRIVVTSASGANGDGQGDLLAFDLNGHSLGAFAPDAAIVDPRGLHVHPDGKHLYVNNGDDRILLLDERGGLVASTVPIERLNPGGGVVGPDGRYCVGSRALRTILALSASLSGPAVPLLPVDVVAFPRGFAFSSDGRLFLAEGASGAGAGAIFAMSAAPGRHKVRLVEDRDLSPLDLAVAPNGNIVASSEIPFGTEDAVTSVREYDPRTGKLVRVFRPDRSVHFQRPRGLRFGPDGRLFCVTRDEIVVFDFESARMFGALVRFDRLHGQAIEFFPRM